MRKKISDEKLFKDHKSLFYSCPIKNGFPSIELNIKGNDNQANILGNGLVILNRIKKDSICFVGLNPSIPEDMDPSGLYDKINVKFDDDKVHYNSLNENDKGNKSNDLQYFKRLQNVAAKIGYNWSALDIFSLRCTNMSAIKDALDKDAKKETPLWNLCKGQFESFKKQIQNLENPKAIIVCNAYASKWFFGEELKRKQERDEEKIEWKIENKISGDIFNDSAFKMKFDDDYGIYVIDDDDCLIPKGTPIFFSGMLSGQRALDMGSLQRLIYHVKWVIDQRSTK